VQRTKLGVIRHAHAADARERLGEGADDEVDLVEHALILGAAQTVGAIGAQRVGFVDEQVRMMRPADADDVAQRRDVAADRIQPLDDDQPVRLGARQPFQLLAQAVGELCRKPITCAAVWRVAS
jgi:hypothetical protein